MAHPLLLSTIDFDDYLRETRERSERTPPRIMNKKIDLDSDEVRITCKLIFLLDVIVTGYERENNSAIYECFFLCRT